MVAAEGMVETINLPVPPATGAMSLDEALTRRRSAREFAPGALTLSEVSQLMWAAQNLLLQAAALGLGATPAGAFNDAEVSRLLHLPDGEMPLYFVPVGRVSR